VTENDIDTAINGIRRWFHVRLWAGAIGAGARFLAAFVSAGMRTNENAKVLGCLLALPLLAGMFVVSVIGGLILGTSASPGGVILGGLLVGVALTVVAFGAYFAVQEYRLPRSVVIWKYFLSDVAMREGPLLAPTAAMAERLAAIFRESDESVLRFGQGARLVGLHHREQRRKRAIDDAIARTEKVAVELRGRVRELEALGERSESGDVAVAEAEAAATGLRDVSAKLGASLSALDGILESTEAEHKARRLHREIDALAKVAHAGPGPVSAEIPIRDATRPLDRQIAAELEVYLALERDARRSLDAVRLVEG